MSMRKSFAPVIVLLVLLASMGALLLSAMRADTATNDEPLFFAAGYTYGEGLGYRLDPEQPPLAKKLSALPLYFEEVKVSPHAQDLLDPRQGFEMTRNWRSEPQTAESLFPQGRNNWYFWPFTEGYALGNLLLFDSNNNAEQLLFRGRLIQGVLTLVTMVVIFLWARQLAGDKAAILAAGLWGFNPIVLASGHLIVTDNGVTLAMLLSVWAFTQFLEKPSARYMFLTGIAVGAALLMKFTAVLLVPMFVVLLLLWRRKLTVSHWKMLPLLLVTVWVTLMVGYAPYWSPPPVLSASDAQQLGVPGWFQSLRPILVPRDFFKGIALQFNHSAIGHEGYLCGEWRKTGWWYYYPVAFVLKTPVALLLLLAAGLALRIKSIRQTSLTSMAPWLAAAVYLACAMTNTINIGVRHLLPMIALLTVGIASSVCLDHLVSRLATLAMCAWLIVATCLTAPTYIPYFNEFSGGTANGYRYLIDSNFDWGQEVKVLRDYLAENKIDFVYQDYFGSNMVLDYYKIHNRRTTGNEGRTIKDGVLVISATRYMRPEWQWLRDSSQPFTRVGQTFFVYKF